MERQVHGFIFEKSIIEKFNLIKEKSHTSEYDAHTSNNIPVQIKLEKENSDIEMADIFRNFLKKEDFILVVGFWKNNPLDIVKIYSVYFKIEDFKKNFDGKLLDDFSQFLENITNNYSDDEKWKYQIKIFRKEWKSRTSNFIRPRFKRDHKNQKRIQCAINNKDFINYWRNGGEFKWE